MYYFTSITTNYLPKARVLARTLKKYNKDAVFILAVSDNLPEDFDISKEYFDYVIYTFEMDAIENPNAFFFRFNITEACTAVKPAVALEIMKQYKAEKVCYLDPDIAVFDKLSEVDDLLDSYSMVFTPHTTIPEDKDFFIVGNEVLFLKRGTNNLGFFAVKNDFEGRKFLEWWKNRLFKFCLDDNYDLKELIDEYALSGLFTDQKWIDMVPSFFDNYKLLKHQGYNVATWNLSHRIVKKNESDGYTVNEEPLKFFHFSGVDSGAHREVLDLLNIEYPHTKSVNEISKWYENICVEEGQNTFKKQEWKYARYSNGNVIPKEHRKILLIRRDAHDYFKNPFEINEGDCFYNWIIREYSEYVDKINLTKNLKKNGIVANSLKKFLMLFLRRDSKVYKKLKKIYTAIKY
ncbi:hypothetical protein HMPREF1142_2016 [Peptostreptococcaceae bacterium AS15]|nr:hypothetical protein HMPREF1142_2016 [Peptostreptococcaceae bacterium AS15]